MALNRGLIRQAQICCRQSLVSCTWSSSQVLQNSISRPLDRRRYSLYTRAQELDRTAPLSSRRQYTPNSIRRFSTTSPAQHNDLTPPKPGEEIHLTIIDKDNHPTPLTVAAGDNLLDIAQSFDLDMEGACGGSCACSTCHVIVESQDMYDRMPEPDDDENDMLDLAFGLTETSRLGCQVKMSKELDGLTVRLPSMTRNLQKSDFEAKAKEKERESEAAGG